MTKNKFTYSGIIPEKVGIRVVFREDVGGTHRVREVLVPWNDLSGTRVLQELDNTIRRRLIEEWSQVDICDPLF